MVNMYKIHGQNPVVHHGFVAEFQPQPCRKVAMPRRDSSRWERFSPREKRCDVDVEKPPKIWENHGMIFPYIENFIIPIYYIIFFRGVATPPTSKIWETHRTTD